MLSCRLSDHTTLRLGGAVKRIVTLNDERALLAAVRAADTAGHDLLPIGGGSNIVAADAEPAESAILIATTGIKTDGQIVHVAAGESWDRFVAWSVADGRADLACLSGIPGSVGATPIQNVGAYGQEVARSIVSVRALDRACGDVIEIAAGDCEFDYRNSRFKRQTGRFLVLSVSFRLPPGRQCTIRYAELARALDRPIGASAPATAVRAAVLALRRRKGMVLDPEDPDTTSAGSFFTNPILSAAQFAALERRLRAKLGTALTAPCFAVGDDAIKTSAAWLIERAGFTRGYGDPRGIAISSKHVLALTNRGGGTTAALVSLAREIASGVWETFGVRLEPEPVFVGHSW